MPDDYRQQVEKALRKARQTAQVKGFRTGNVPMSMIKKIYERSYVAEEVSKMVQDRIAEYLEGETRKPIGDIMPCDAPVDWASDEFEFSFEVAFYPARLDFSFDDIIIPYYDITVRAEDIDNRIGLLRESYGYSASVETAEENDAISAVCKLSDAEDATEKYVKFLMQKIPAEYKSLFAGARKDDRIEVELRKVFPDDVDLSNMLQVSADELDALPATAVVTVTEISRFVPAEMNADFFGKVDESLSSEEEFRAFVGESAKIYHERLSLRKLADDAINLIYEKSGIELPADFVKKNLAKANKDMELSYIEANLSATIESMTQKYIIDALLEREGVTINEQEIVDKAWDVTRVQADTYGLYDIDMREVVQSRLKNEKNIQQFVSYIKEDKFALLVKTRAKLDVRQVSIAEFRELSKYGYSDDVYSDDDDQPDFLSLGAASNSLEPAKSAE
jgi:trigger factor